MKILALVLLLAGKAVADGMDDDLTQSIRDIFDVNVEESGRFASFLPEHAQVSDNSFTALPAPQEKTYAQKAEDDIDMPAGQFAELGMESDTGRGQYSDHVISSFKVPDSLDKDLHLFRQSSETSDPLAKEEIQSSSLALGSSPVRQQRIRTHIEFEAPALLSTKTVAAPALTSIPVKTDDEQAMKAELALPKNMETSAASAVLPARQLLPKQVLGVAPTIRVPSLQSIQPKLELDVASATQSSVVSRTALPASPRSVQANPMSITLRAKQTLPKEAQSLGPAMPSAPSPIEHDGGVPAFAPTKRESAAVLHVEKTPIPSMRVDAAMVTMLSVPVASVSDVKPAQSLAGMAAAAVVNPVKSGQLKASSVVVRSNQVQPKQDMSVAAAEQGSAALPARNKVGVSTAQASLLSAALPPLTSNVQPSQALPGTATAMGNSVQSRQPMAAPVVSPTRQAQLKQDSLVLPLKQTMPDALPVANKAPFLRVRTNVPSTSMLPLPVAPVLSAKPPQASVGVATAPMNPVQNRQPKSAPSVLPAKIPQAKQPGGLQVKQASAVVPAGSQAPIQNVQVSLPPAAMLPIHAAPSVQHADGQVSVEAASGVQTWSGKLKVEPAGLPVNQIQPKQNTFVSQVAPVQPNSASHVIPAGQMPPKQAQHISAATWATKPESIQPFHIPAVLPSMQVAPAQTLPPMPAPAALLLKQLTVPAALPVTAISHAQNTAARLLAEEKQKMEAEAAGLKADMEEVRGLLKEAQVAMKSVRIKNVSQELVETKTMQSSNASNRPLRLSEQATATADMKDTWTWRFFSQLRSVFAAPAYSEAPLVQQPANKPRSLANFWLPDLPPLAHTHAMALLAVQKPKVDHRQNRPDFMDLRAVADDLHDVQISDPSAELEDEDRQELRRWQHLNKDLKHQPLKLEKSTKQSPELVAMLHGGQNHINAVWADLERQDKSIQERIVELDDPRQPPDLQTYQQLNQLQDDSMELLENNLRHASPRLRHYRRDR